MSTEVASSRGRSPSLGTPRTRSWAAPVRANPFGCQAVTKDLRHAGGRGGHHDRVQDVQILRPEPVGLDIGKGSAEPGLDLHQLALPEAKSVPASQCSGLDGQGRHAWGGGPVPRAVVASGGAGGRGMRDLQMQWGWRW
ncbi:uncharacterized protein J3R85_018012 [Psidium guajava]|nr:uncharacterized protein J3R85_018012 [Psidium guajava]